MSDPQSCLSPGRRFAKSADVKDVNSAFGPPKDDPDDFAEVLHNLLPYTMTHYGVVMQSLDEAVSYMEEEDPYVAGLQIFFNGHIDRMEVVTQEGIEITKSKIIKADGVEFLAKYRAVVERDQGVLNSDLAKPDGDNVMGKWMHDEILRALETCLEDLNTAVAPFEQ